MVELFLDFFRTSGMDTKERRRQEGERRKKERKLIVEIILYFDTMCKRVWCVICVVCFERKRERGGKIGGDTRKERDRRNCTLFCKEYIYLYL